MKSRKLYRSISANRLTISLTRKNGGLFVAQFGGANSYLGVKGLYDTTVKEEQDLLEHCPQFGKSFILEKEWIVSEPKRKAQDGVDVAPTFITKKFDTLKKCQAYLEINYGIKAYTVNSKQKCIDAAKEQGLIVEFEEK